MVKRYARYTLSYGSARFPCRAPTFSRAEFQNDRSPCREFRSFRTGVVLHRLWGDGVNSVTLRNTRISSRSFPPSLSFLIKKRECAIRGGWNRLTVLISPIRASVNDTLRSTSSLSLSPGNRVYPGDTNYRLHRRARPVYYLVTRTCTLTPCEARQRSSSYRNYPASSLSFNRAQFRSINFPSPCLKLNPCFVFLAEYRRECNARVHVCIIRPMAGSGRTSLLNGSIGSPLINGYIN